MAMESMRCFGLSSFFVPHSPSSGVTGSSSVVPCRSILLAASEFSSRFVAQQWAPPNSGVVPTHGMRPSLFARVCRAGLWSSRFVRRPRLSHRQGASLGSRSRRVLAGPSANRPRPFWFRLQSGPGISGLKLPVSGPNQPLEAFAPLTGTPLARRASASR